MIRAKPFRLSTTAPAGSLILSHGLGNVAQSKTDAPGLRRRCRSPGALFLELRFGVCRGGIYPTSAFLWLVV